MADPIDVQAAGLGATILAGLSLAYRFMRRVKDDNRTDKAMDEAAAILRAERERADRFAAERNAALVENATLRERLKRYEEAT